MRKKICIVSSSRADLGQLSNIIKKFQESKNFKTSFVITGSHLSKFTKHSYKESEKFSLNVTKKILINFSKFDEQNINIYFSEYVRKFSKYFFKNKPDLLLVLGDRYEILAVVIAAFYLNIKIIHLHGGELTLGSKDDATRHAITKLSNYHFVANEIFKKRLLNMGEHPKNIFNVGSPSLDNIKKLKLHSIATLEKNLNISLQKNFIIVTIHPEAEKKATIKLINNLFRVLEGLKDIKILICSPNADAFSDIIRIKIKKFVKENNNSYFFNNLGFVNYLSLSNLCHFVIGNSSSAITEIPFLGTPSINIGLRQSGRPFSKSIFNTGYSYIKMRQSVIYLLKKKRRYKNQKLFYYNNNTNKKILNLINKININNNNYKKFFDI